MLILKTKKCVIFLAILIIVLFAITECKRGGGRRGGTYRGSNVWGRAKQSHNAPGNYDMYGQRRAKQSQSSATAQDPNKKVESKPSETPKASAPPAPTNQDTVKKSAAGDSSASFIQQEKKQQTAPLGSSNPQQQRPIGWDVGQSGKPEPNINRNVQTGLANQPQQYPAQAGSSNYYGTGNNYNYGAPPPYSPSGTNVGNYHQNGPPPPYSPSGTNVGNYHQNGPPPPYSPSGTNMGNYNNYGPPPPYSPNGYHNYGAPPSYSPNQAYSGYGQSPMYGNNYYGGGTGQAGGGMFGNMFGSNKYGKQGFGGVGGYGGWGGYNAGGYGKRYGGGFGMGFGKHAFRNVMIGLLVWNLVSGFTRRPYYVYNYYNNPERVPDEIPLSVNAIVLCPENVTSLCAPNTAALCTNNATIMCVVLAQETVPCAENSTMKCANSTITCTDGTEDGCEDNKKKTDVTTAVNIPCITNATITGKILDNTTIAFSGTGILLNKGNLEDTTRLCVTTLALPQPEEEANQGVKPLCDTENSNSTSCISSPSGLPNNTSAMTNLTDSTQENISVPPLAM